MQALLLEIGSDRYAIDLAAVAEVVPAVEVTPVPRGPRTAVGIFNLRGDILPLFDTAALLGVPGRGRDGHVVVVEAHDGMAALTTDGPVRRVELGAPAGEASVPGGIERRAVEGRVATLLEVDALLATVGA